MNVCQFAMAFSTFRLLTLNFQVGLCRVSAGGAAAWGCIWFAHVVRNWRILRTFFGDGQKHLTVQKPCLPKSKMNLVLGKLITPHKTSP